MKKTIMILLVSGLLGGSFFKYSTLYCSYSLGSPHQTKDNFIELEDNYSLNLGLRKIARYQYQVKDDYYRGDEESITDNATMGSVDGWEYLFHLSGKQLNNLEFQDLKFWIRNSTDHFMYKFKYYNIESRNLEFAQLDLRYRIKIKSLDLTAGMAVFGHPAFGYDAFSEYDDYWWILAREYGYTDYLEPLHDLNGNGEIDEYWIWIETDPDTLEGYWEYFYEGGYYYWLDPDGNFVANSDGEFEQYHLPGVVDQYNQDQIDDLGYQSTVALVIGLDYFYGGEKFYFHTWGNVFPTAKSLTDFSFTNDDKYEIGLLIGVDFNKFGVFLETNYLSMFKEEYTLETGINYKFK
jgi:hypothetical protein